MNRSLATLLAVALWGTTGCSYHLLDMKSEPAPATLKAKTTLPVSARLSTVVSMWYREGGLAHDYKQGPAFEASRIRTLLDDSKLFRGVSADGPSDRVVSLAFSARMLTPMAGGLEITRILSSLFVIGLPFDFFFIEHAPPFDMECTLECRAPNGELVGSYKTTASCALESQAFGQTHSCLDDAFTQLVVPCEKVLVGKLVADEGLAGLLAAARETPAPVGAKPVSAPRPEPAPPPPPAPAPAPARPRGVAKLGNTYVLVVGVNEYRDEKISKLRCAEADAREVYAFFATENKSPTAPDRVEIIVGKDATRVAVLRAIREHLVAKATREDDLAILFFAGHGFADTKDTYLACADSQLDLLPETSISGSTLRTYWSEIRAGRKLLLTDACHSGGLENMRGIGGVVVAPDEKVGSVSVTIAASGANELSAEDPRTGHGVFTQALLNGLRGDASRGGAVTIGDLASFLEKQVPSLAARAQGKQTPVVRGLGADGEGIPLTR